MIKAKFEDLIVIDEVGEIVAESLITYFNDLDNITIINNCFDFGVQFVIPKKESHILKDQIFVITGTLSDFTRLSAKEFIEKNGGIVSGSISKKTSFLVCGTNPGSKYNKAKILNIKIIGELQLKELINV